MNGNQQIDLNSIFNYMVIFMVVFMGMRVMDRALEAPKERSRMLGGGKLPPGYKPLAHHHSLRRYGEPKSEEERATEHEARFGSKEVPPRGSGHEEMKKTMASEEREAEHERRFAVIYFFGT